MSEQTVNATPIATFDNLAYMGEGYIHKLHKIDDITARPALYSFFQKEGRKTNISDYLDSLVGELWFSSELKITFPVQSRVIDIKQEGISSNASLCYTLLNTLPYISMDKAKKNILATNEELMAFVQYAKTLLPVFFNNEQDIQGIVYNATYEYTDRDDYPLTNKTHAVHCLIQDLLAYPKNGYVDIKESSSHLSQAELFFAIVVAAQHTSNENGFLRFLNESLIYTVLSAACFSASTDKEIDNLHLSLAQEFFAKDISYFNDTHISTVYLANILTLYPNFLDWFLFCLRENGIEKLDPVGGDITLFDSIKTTLDRHNLTVYDIFSTQNSKYLYNMFKVFSVVLQFDLARKI